MEDTSENKLAIMRRILRMVKEGDPMFMYLDDDVISGFERGGFLVKISNEDMSGVMLTAKGEEFLTVQN